MAVQDYLKSMDFPTLRDLMLDMAPQDVDRSEGSFLYDAVTPIALFTSEIFNQMQLILSESFIGSATGANLDNIAATMPRLYRRPATSERLKLHLEPYTAQIFETVQSGTTTLKFANSAGELFSINTDVESPVRNMGTYINVFVIKDSLGDGSSVKGEAMEPQPAIDGLSVCQIEEITANGDDEESDDEFRVRIWATMASPFLGSVADYQRKIFAEFPSSPNGFIVSNCMIIPRGSRSGYICVIPAKLSVDNETIHCTSGEIESLQNYLDERIGRVGGFGTSVAPIGHVIKVRDFSDFNLDFHVEVVAASGTSGGISADSLVRTATIAYLQSIINEVIPSVTNYSQAARRFVVFLIYYYLNAHESAILTTLRQRFGASMIRNVVVKRVITPDTPEINYYDRGEFIFVTTDEVREGYIEVGGRPVPYNDFFATYEYAGSEPLPEGLSLEFIKIGQNLGFRYTNSGSAFHVEKFIVKETLTKTLTEQKDLVLRSGDSKGVLPMLRNLYVSVTEEGVR